MVPLLCLVLGTLFSSSCKGQIGVSLDLLINFFFGMAHAVYKSQNKNALGYDGRIVLVQGCGR